MKPTIKIGDSFSVPIQFFDTDDNAPMLLTDEMHINCQIINTAGNTIAVPSVKKLENGFILLQVNAQETQQWKAGSAQLDIKLQVNNQVRHSQNFQFWIERSITI